jgi:hypothetical protein
MPRQRLPHGMAGGGHLKLRYARRSKGMEQPIVSRRDRPRDTGLASALRPEAVGSAWNLDELRPERHKILCPWHGVIQE